MQEISMLLAPISKGILLGLVYGIAAMGLTLIWGVMGVFNFSHGAIITLGMFSSSFVFFNLGINPLVSLVPVAIIGLLLGITIYFIAVHKIIDRPYSSTLLTTLSAGMIITGIAITIFTPSYFKKNLHIGTQITAKTHLIAIMIAFLVATAAYIFLYRSHLGKRIRAVTNDREAAELVGIPTAKLLALSFGIGSMLATISGALIASFLPFNSLSGTEFGLKGFIIIVLGGLGNPVGALLGGLTLGIFENVFSTFLESSWIPVIEFGLLVGILLLQGNGVLGAKE